ENNCPWDNNTCYNAIKYPNIFKWCIDNGCPWNNNLTCTFASLYGSLDILQWARSPQRKNNHCWSIEVYYNAIRNGHDTILKWALENGCPWDQSLWPLCEEYGRSEILIWANENGYIQ